MSPSSLFIDAHCHLGKNLRYPSVVPAVLNSGHSREWESIYQLCSHHSEVIPGFGIHPWETNFSNDQTVQNLEKKIQGWIYKKPDRTPCVIGEIGLHGSPQQELLTKQKSLFEAQLILAQKYLLVPCIHCVKAWEPLRKALSKYPPPRGLLVHDYSGSIEFLNTLLPFGTFVSFSEKSFTKNPQKKISLIKKIPSNRYLLESDQEYPSNLQALYQKVASLINISKEELVQQMRTNFVDLFE